jgi:Type II CAAX prenyl endopeptidase Rce1-like
VPFLKSPYWSASRAPRYGLLFVLPLFLLYEGLAAGLSDLPGTAHVRNAADVALKTPFILMAGSRGTIAFFATIAAACAFLVSRDITRSKDRPKPRVFLLMLAESAVLALLLGVVVATITQQLLGMSMVAQSGAPALAQMGPATRFMLALGAGLYEELLFRVLLVGGIAAGLRWLAGGKGKGWISGSIAAVVGALVFSAFHYVGDFGDKFQLASFTYRAVAGLAFSGLYLTRGFGITAWTHALYDVYVMVF